MTSTLLESSTNRSGVASVSPPAYNSVSSTPTPTARNNSKFGNGRSGADPSRFRVCTLATALRREREKREREERDSVSE